MGRKKPNAFGLHDMHGNVWEWCSSVAREYPYDADDGREDPSDDLACRVLRGGAWRPTLRDLRSAHRQGRGADYTHQAIGLRVCADVALPG